MEVTKAIDDRWKVSLVHTNAIYYLAREGWKRFSYSWDLSCQNGKNFDTKIVDDTIKCEKSQNWKVMVDLNKLIKRLKQAFEPENVKIWENENKQNATLNFQKKKKMRREGKSWFAN